MQAYLLLFFLYFGSIWSAEWTGYYDAVLDHSALHYNFDLTANDRFELLMKKARANFPELLQLQFASWNHMAQYILSLRSDKSTKCAVVNPLMQVELPLIPEWVICFQNILRYGNFTQPVLVDISQVFVDPLDPDDQIMKIDILFNLKNVVTVDLLSAYYPFFDDRLRHYLTAFQKAEETAQQKFDSKDVAELLDLKGFALMFGDSFIDEELDPEGAALEGGDPCTCGCLVAKLLDSAENMVSDIVGFAEFDIVMLRRIKRSINDSVLINTVLKMCKGHPNPFELFEDILISLLRGMPDDQEYLFNSGFVKHAMLVAISRTGTKFNISVYNSGSGIKYHSFRVKGKHEKYIPLLRFVNVPLYRLKNLGFFRKLAEIYGSYAYGFDTLDSGSKKAFDSKNMYENVLSILHPYESLPTAVEASIQNLVTSQRSGVCAYRCFMVYIASKMKGFRFLKLLMSRVALNTALEKEEFKTTASPVARRLVKFALENYARSVEKFGAKENIFGVWNIDTFGDDSFWGKHAQYARVWPVVENKTFEINTGFYDSVVSNKQVPAFDPYSGLIAQAYEAEQRFNDTYFTSPSPPLNLLTDYNSIFEAAMAANLDASNFIAHLEALIKLVSSSWLGIPDSDKLGFLTSTIINRWPFPSYEQDLYDVAFSEVPEFMINQKKLFGLATKMVHLMCSDMKWYPQIFFAFAKILAIYHKIMVKIHEPFKTCIPFGNLAQTLDIFSPVMFDSSIHGQMEKLRHILLPKDGKVYFDIMAMKLLHEPGNVIVDYLKGFVVEHKLSYDGTLETKVTELFSKKAHTFLPYALYYWRDMCILAGKLTGKIEGETLHYTIPFVDENKVYDPLTSCDLTKIEDSSEDSGCINKIYRKSCQNWKEELVQNVMVDTSYRVSDFNTGNMPIRRYFETNKSTVLRANVTDNFFFSSRSGMLRSDRYVSFLNLLDECKSYISLNNFLNFGYQAIDSMRYDHESLTLLLDILLRHLSYDLESLSRMEEQLMDKKNIIPDVSNLAERTTVLLFLSGYVSSITTCLVKTLDELKKLRAFYYTLCGLDGNPEYIAIMQLGFLASFQAGPDKFFDKDDAKMILLLNQTFAKISKALSDHLRFEGLKFSAKMNVSHAVYSFYKTCGPEDKIQELSSLPVDPNLFRPFFPWLAISGSVLIDLLSGTIFKGASRVSTFVDDEVNTTFHLAQMNTDKYEITEIISGIRGNSILTTYDFKPGTKFHVDEPEKTTGIISGRSHVTRLETIKSNTLSHRVRFNNGQFAYLIREQPKNFWGALPIPAGCRQDIPYLVWVFPATKEVVFDSESGCIWAKTGLTTFTKERLSGLRHLPWFDKFAAPLAPEPRFPLSPKHQVSLYFKSENTGSELYILFKKLTDLEANRLIFYHKCEGDNKWVYKSNENYSVASEQNFVSSKFIKYSLVLQNEAHRKVFIPITHTLVTQENMEGSEDDPTQQIKCVFIPLNEQNVLDPKTQLQLLVMAYHYLIARNYVLSMEALIRIHHMEGFSDEELRVLGWMVNSGIDNHDGSPESTSIRSFAAYLVFANANLHAKGYILTPEMSELDLVIPTPYASGFAWRARWSRLISRELRDEVITKTVKRYYRVRSKVPIALRHDPRSRRQLITKYEEQRWLEFVDVKIYSSGNTGLYLIPSITQFSASRPLNGPLMQYHLLSGKYKIERTLDLDRVSWVFPEVIITKFPLVLVEMLFTEFSPSEKQKYVEFLQGLRDTSFTSYAKALYDVLTNASVRDSWRSCIPEAKVDPINSAMKILHWRNQLEKAKNLPISYRSQKENDTEETMPIGFEIETKNFPDFDGKQEIDMEALKSSGDLVELKSALQQLLAYRKSIVELLSKSTGNKSTKRQLIAKGSFTFVRSDFFRLYVQASSSYYSHLLPDIKNPEDYQNIHDLITKYVLLQTNINDIKRMIAAYEKRDANQIAKEIGRHRFTTSQDRIPLAYEFFINSRLDLQQLNDFKALMQIGKVGDSPKLIQRIMSAGKTFVYGTCLAVGHADGEHLSILVVPKSLFTSEATSIFNRTMAAFSYDGFSFQIARDSEVSKPETLEWIYHSLLKAIKMRKYLIMPPETLLVLQNLFFENSLRASENANYKILKKICALLKNKAVLTFDEVDTIFEPIHELNFSVSNSLESDENSDLLRLQGYLLGELFYCLLSPEIRSIQDITLNKLITEDDYSKIRPLLAKKMAQKLIREEFILDVMNNPRMPKGLFGDEDEGSLASFFDLEPKKLGPFREIFSNVSGIRLTLLSLCRLAIQDWIYMSWSGNVNENYGVSPNPEVLYAIPYLGAGNPKVNSEFSFRWYAYTRTFRMYMVLGFGRSAFEKSLAWIKKKILVEDTTSTSEELLRKLFDIGPYGLNLKSKEQISSLFGVVDSFHKNRNEGDTYFIYLFDWIASDLLPSISFFSQQISSNCQDIPMMVKSYCAYSGTVPSTKQLPPMMHKAKYVDLKDDITERIKEAVLRNSPAQVLVVPTGLTSKQFFETIKLKILENETGGSPFSAVIDVGAYFKDETNETVAETLLGFKEAIIFYGTEGKGKNKPIISTATEKNRLIADASRTGIQHLGFADSTRVTYFDQQHVVGTDIHHDPTGFAVVIVGVKTSTRDFYQAVMRMRSLLENQKLLVVVPKDAYVAISSYHGSNRPDLKGCLEYMEHNLAVKRKKLNLMSLFKIIRAQFKEAIYEKLLKFDGSSCPEVGLWIKETEAKIELLAMPQSERATFELVDQFINHLSGISEPYIDAGRLAEVNKKVRKIFERAKLAEEEYESTMTVYSAADEPTKNEDITGVGEQLMEHQIEAAKLVDLEVQNTTTPGFFSKTFSTPFILDFSVPYFPEVFEYSLQSDSVEPGFLCINKFFKANLVFNLLSDVFDDRIYVSKGFTDVFFGKRRNLIFDVLVLTKKDGPADSQGDVEMPSAERRGHEMKLVILSSLEANAFMNLRTSSVFGGYLGQLLSPSEHSDINQAALGIDLEEYRQAMAEILIFGGYYNKLSEPEWLMRFERWLGDGPTRLLKSAIFREIILDELEWKDAIRCRLPITKSCLHQLSQYEHQQLIESPGFIVLNFLCRKKYPLIGLYESIASNTASVNDFEVLLAETEAAFMIDEDGLIISSVLPKLLSAHSKMKFESGTEETMWYKRFGYLALGLSHCPKKLLKVIEFAVSTLDLNVDQNFMAVSALSEALGVIMIKQTNISEDVSAMIRRIAAAKVFNRYPNQLQCLYAMISPLFTGYSGFQHIFQNLGEEDRGLAEQRFKLYGPTHSVKTAYYESEFEKALMRQGAENFPQGSLVHTVLKYGKLISAPVLLKYCRTNASLGHAVELLFQDDITKQHVLETLRNEYTNKPTEDSREYIIGMLRQTPLALPPIQDPWAFDEPNKRFKSGH